MKYLLISILILFVSCGDVKKGEILYYDHDNNKISYKVVDFENIDGFSNLKNKYFEFLLNAKFSEYMKIPKDKNVSNMTINNFEEYFYQEKGNSPALRYRLEDNTIIPLTLKDSVLLTLFYNMNASMEFFINLGLDLNKGILKNDKWEPMKVFFDLEWISPNEFNEKENTKDNAYYFRLMKIMAFLQQDELKNLALANNPFVITHEFGHAIFDYYAQGRVEGNKLLSSYLPQKGNCNNFISEFYKSGLNEGYSDYWASVFTKNSEVLYLSLTKKNLGNSEISNRELNNNKTLNENMLLTSFDVDCQNLTLIPNLQLGKTKSYYWGGTVWASTLWEIYKNVGDFNKLVLKSYSCLNQHFSSGKSTNFALGGNCLVRTLKENNVNQGDINKVCKIIKKRFPSVGILFDAGEFNECD